MWISRKDFIVLPYLCSQEYMVERRAYHLSQKKTHQKIARFRSVSVKRKERPLIEGLGVQKHLFEVITRREKNNNVNTWVRTLKWDFFVLLYSREQKHVKLFQKSNI